MYRYNTDNDYFGNGFHPVIAFIIVPFLTKATVILPEVLSTIPLVINYT
jgi:hypothetical protein